MQVEQIGHAVFALGGFCTLGVGQNGRYFGVGKSRVAPHHGWVKLVGRHLAVAGNEHVAHHAQALHLGVQGTQPVGELLGQHGNHAARKVHAGGAVVSVNVNGAACVHVMAHVGNGNQQPPALHRRLAPALRGGLAVDGIVKVACVFAVNGHQRNIGQIDAVFFVGWQHLVGQRASQRNAGVGELMRHAVFAHGNLDLHAGVVNLAQHFLHAAHGLAKERGRLDQFHHHHLARFGGTGSAFGDQHVLAIALVFGCHQPDAAFLQQPANDGLWRALHDLDHASFGTALAVTAHNARLDAVFVQHGTHFVGRQINVRPAVITRYKPMAIAMAVDGSFNFVQQAAGLAIIFDTISFFPEMPRWRNW